MGFSTNLQRKSSHEALLARQDAEIRLLENMRRCLILRVKCDREYAVALSSVVIQAQKFDKGDDLSGSLVARAWRTMIDETETFSKLIKKNADALASENLEELSSLVCEKRNWRKNYNEERYQMISKLSVCLELVNKTKSHYERSLDNYKVGKQKYEESCAKNKGQRKSDEAKDKFLRCCKRLHLAHNDYVLALNEASSYERDLRSILLPGILEYQQTVQEQGIKLWKETLEGVVQKTNFCTTKFQENYAKIKCSVEDISPQEEYSEFIDSYKSLPMDPVTFQFDTKLLEDSPSKLLPNAVVVDDLTIDELKKKMSELDIKLKDCLNDIKETSGELVKYENHLAAIRKSSSTASRSLEMKHNVDVLTKKLCKLKCQEESLQKQLDLISTPILELGCEEAPAGCELKGDLPETPGAETMNAPATNSTNTINRKQTQKIVEMFCKPFTRKPSVGALNSETLEKDVGQAATVPEKTKYTNKYQIFFSHPERPLVDEEWFHGVLPREDVTRLLVNDGDFLVRETTRHDERLIVLSVCWSGHRHFIIQSSGSEYRFEGPSFPTIQELVNYQFESGNPVTTKSGAILKTPILREGWELHNDDVILTEKIGRGNFGDVFKGKLKTANVDVAVKICRHTRAEEQKKKFLQEGRILKQYDHPNIVKLIGICVQKQPVMIVMELVPGGSLLTFLKKNAAMFSEMPNKYPLKMCKDVVGGMAYLESRGCIHRDLAARNCLIGHDNIVKISDFGMSREEEEYVVSNGMKEIPIKWTAPEALNFGVYTSSCDIWSYGVLCWEIFSFGQTPYSGYTNTQARELIESGYRMPCPGKCPAAMYELMLKCWSYNPKDRPNFVNILKRIEALIDEL